VPITPEAKTRGLLSKMFSKLTLMFGVDNDIILRIREKELLIAIKHFSNYKAKTRLLMKKFLDL